ncbi:hypothetical protein [Ottowia sp.]|uniref:hypothetical protein n=1 Tax=Ottowia sp. TaxID=1898956 RepID=UPI0025DF1426|nr:hypothetical protein [Ottowia sp.]MBK6616217.1 hypothetical protein [Ottowia sp.]
MPALEHHRRLPEEVACRPHDFDDPAQRRRRWVDQTTARPNSRFGASAARPDTSTSTT